MRGLPFNAVKDEILEFLSGINVINRENGVFLIKTFDGRSTGDAFVLLPNEDDAVQDTDYLKHGYRTDRISRSGFESGQCIHGTVHLNQGFSESI